MKVLLPTDFSDNAFNAIKYAVKLLKEKTCTFYLLNTYTPIIYNYDFQMHVAGGLGKVEDVIRNHSATQLENIKNKLRENYHSEKHSFEMISSFNTFTEEVKEKVDELDIDLIVMGTKGASGVKEVLFGSNTIHIIKKSKCPVMAIPDGYFFEIPKNILFPTDFEIDYNEKQIYVLKEIASLFDIKLHILHVSRSRELDEKEEENLAKLKSLLNDLKYEVHIVPDQEIPQAINEFQKSNYTELLMMINNKHSFFENLFFKPVINQIGFHLTVPFLVTPSEP